MSAPTGDAVCQECRLPNPPWFAESSVWNASADRHEVLCVRCFAKRASDAVTWRLVPELNLAWMRRRRSDKAMTLRALAGLVGVGVPYLSKVERNRERPSTDLILAIVRELS